MKARKIAQCILCVTALWTCLCAEVWNTDVNNATWNTPGNWNPASVPNAVGATADFNGVITGNRNVDVNGTFTVGTLIFDNANNYTLQNNMLNLDDTVSPANITVSTANGNGAHTIQSDLNLVDDTTILQNSAGNFTISGEISGSKSLTITGGGILILDGANTYTGGTTFNGATTRISADNNLGVSGGLTFGPVGAALNTTDTLSFSRSVILTGNGTFDTDATTLTISGLISGAGTLIKTGSGVLLLPFFANTYAGGTRINEGTVRIGSDGVLGNVAGGLTFGTSGGTLNSTETFTSSRAITLTGNGTFDTDMSRTLTLSGIASGAGALIKTGTGTLVLTGANSHMGGTTINAGTLVLTGANTYTGGTTINAGIVQVGADNNLGNAAGGLIFNGGTLRTTASITTPRVVTLNAGGGTFNTEANTVTLDGVISGAGALNKTGTGTLVLTGANTYMGGTTVNDGTVQVSASNNLGSLATDLTFGASGGTLNTTTGFPLNRNVTLTGNGTFDTDASTTLSIGTVSGAGALIKANTGTLVLTGANTYMGGTQLNAGTLQVSADNYLGNVAGGLTFGASGATLNTTATFPSARAVTLTGDGTFDTNATTLTLSGEVSGAGALIKADTGTLVLAGANTYMGGTTINAGTVSVGANNNLGNVAGGLIFGAGGATLNTTADFSSARAIALTGDGTFDTDATTLTLSGVVSGVGALIKADTGTLVLIGANTYMGGTTMNAGTVSVGADNSLGDAAGGLTFNGGTLRTTASFIIPRAFITLNAGGGTFNTEANTVTLQGVLSGTGTLIKTGTGTLILTGVNTYTGGTRIGDGINEGGTVRIVADNNLGDLAGGLTFDFASNPGILNTTANFTSARAVTLTGPGTFDTNMGTTLTLSGIASGAGALNKAGTGTLVLTGANNYMGGTTINAGTLQVGVDANLGVVGGITFNGGILNTTGNFTHARPVSLNSVGGTFNTSGVTVLTQSGLISGGVTLTKSGTGTLELTAPNTFIAPTVVTDGTLQLTGAGVISSTSPLTLQSTSTFTITAGAGTKAIGTLTGAAGTSAFLLLGTDLIVNQTTNTAFSGQIFGTGDLTKNGTGTLTLSGTSVFMGTTTVNAGTLVNNGGLGFTPFIVNSGVLTGSGIFGSTTVNGGTVRGTGTYDDLTVNGGTVSPGNSIGTITVMGPYTQASGAILEIEIQGTTNDLVDVGGTATIDNGAILNVTFLDGTCSVGQTHDILTATGGINQLWTTINVPPNSEVTAQLVNSDTIARLTVTQCPPVPPVPPAPPVRIGNTASGNPLAVKCYLECLDPPANCDLACVIANLSVLCGNELNCALNQLHPGLFGAFELANLDNNALIAAIISDQMNILPCNQRQCFLQCCDEEDAQPAAKTNSFWVAPFGNFTDVDHFGQLRGYDTRSGGVVIGFDHCLPKQFLFGLAGGYTYTDLDWDQSAGDATIQKGFVSVYGGYTYKCFSVDASVIGGGNFYDVTRNIDFCAVRREADNDHNAGFVTTHLGADFGVCRKMVLLDLFGSFDYFYLHQPEYKESGAASLNLRVDAKNSSMIRGQLGGQIAKDFTMKKGCLRPFAAVSWVRKSQLSDNTYTAKFVDSTCSCCELTVETFGDHKDFVSPEAGLIYTVNTFSFSAIYRGEFGSDYMVNQANLQLGWVF